MILLDDDAYHCASSVLLVLVLVHAQAMKVTRVHFMDDSCKAFGIEENATADQLKSIITERMGMKEESCFFIFEKKDGWGASSSSAIVVSCVCCVCVCVCVHFT